MSDQEIRMKMLTAAAGGKGAYIPDRVYAFSEDDACRLATTRGGEPENADEAKKLAKSLDGYEARQEKIQAARKKAIEDAAKAAEAAEKKRRAEADKPAKGSRAE